MRNRVKELREKRGWTQTDLGEAIGVHWQTISRIENSRTRIMPKRESALATVFDLNREDLYVRELRTVRVQQHVQAGFYEESNIWPDDAVYEVAVPDDPVLSMFKLYGAETRGPSMNLRYPERTVLVYASIWDTNESPAVGSRYIVEREAPDGMRETTVKTLSQDDTGRFWLVPESTDPTFHPIPLDGEEGETVRIVGRVYFSVRRE